MRLPVDYPEALESWWLSRAQQQLDADDPLDALEALGPQVQQLSDRFIAAEGSRELRGYGDEEAMLLAYGLFFFPQTFTRVQFPLAELWGFRGWRPAGRPLRILDLGAGLGAASLGALCGLGELRKEPHSVEILALEMASKSLDLYQKITEDLAQQWPHCSWEFHRGDLKQAPELSCCQGPWDLIVASFSINEAFEHQPLEQVHSWIGDSLGLLADGGILLLLEPASLAACQRLQQLRLCSGAAIWGPCLHQEPCPLLEQALGCHEVRSWQIPPSLGYLNRKMYRALQSLKYSYLALGREPPPAAPAGSFRMISPMAAQKGRWLASGCMESGQKWPLEWASRHIKGPDKALFKGLRRGDILALETQAPVEAHPSTGTYRLPKGAKLQPLWALELHQE